MGNLDFGLRAGVSFVFALIAGFNYFGHLKLDNVTLALLIAAAAPWLAFVFKSVKIPNLIELELQELHKKVDEAKGAAESATNVAAFAAAETKPSAEPLKRFEKPSGITAAEAVEEDPRERLAALSKEYNSIRATQKSGTARTQEMMAIVRQMVDLAPHIRAYDVKGKLRSQDRGERLSAYAYLYASPDYEMLEQLVESLTKNEERFGQYWALKALSQVLGRRGDRSVPLPIINSLKMFRDTLPRGTDRDYELNNILRDINKYNPYD